MGPSADRAAAALFSLAARSCGRRPEKGSDCGDVDGAELVPGAGCDDHDGADTQDGDRIRPRAEVPPAGRIVALASRAGWVWPPGPGGAGCVGLRAWIVAALAARSSSACRLATSNLAASSRASCCLTASLLAACLFAASAFCRSACFLAASSRLACIFAAFSRSTSSLAARSFSALSLAACSIAARSAAARALAARSCGSKSSSPVGATCWVAQLGSPDTSLRCGLATAEPADGAARSVGRVGRPEL